MQAITPALAAILRSHFQAGAQGFRARLEASTFIPGVPPAGLGIIQVAYNGSYYASFAEPVTPGHTLVALVADRGPSLAVFVPGFTDRASGYTQEGGDFRGSALADMVVPTPATLASPAGDAMTFESSKRDVILCVIETNGVYSASAGQTNMTPTSPVDCGGPLTPPAGDALLLGVTQYGALSYAVYGTVTPDADVSELVDAGNGPHGWMGYRLVEEGDGATAYSVSGTVGSGYGYSVYCGATAVYVPADDEGDGSSGSALWTPHPIESVSIDKSLRMTADQAEISLVNENQPYGWGPTSLFRTNQRVRVYQWYGENDNEVRTFTGIIDKVLDQRDPLMVTLSCRDMMALLIDQTFSATAPQATGETGAVRTPANGVYLNMEVSDIVRDILDRAGWPDADRDVTDTSYVLDEFIVSDGSSWADAMIGDAQLTGLVGYSAWADEAGVFHFGPTLISQNLTDPELAHYVFRTGQDIIALDDETDQYELFTRIKVRGPLTTTVLSDTWRELWRTSKLKYPVGIYYRPSDPTMIRVIDRGTKRMYRIRQSDRHVMSSVYLGTHIPHPLGLSGDPADSTHYWVLNAPWRDGGSTSGNTIKKVRFSDNAIVASFSIPDGRWSAIKASSSFLWLTNLDTDAVHKKSKTDGSALGSFQHTYGSTLQHNPSGLMIDGTTLSIFWSNGGTTARFLVCDEATPTTIIKAVKTTGTALHGGEMDTTTHTECYGDSDSLHLLAKFTLVNAEDQTNEVFAEVVDTELEDELGELAIWGNREHDTHPTDPDHPFEIRRMTLDLTVITNLAQATETAQRQLDIVSQRRRVLDAGIAGNPALQKTDYVRVIDDMTGIGQGFAVDTYRSLMSGSGTYLGTIALLPVESLTDTPDEETEVGLDLLLQPPTLDSGAALYAPLVVGGTRSVSLGLIDAGRAIYAPTIVGGRLVVSPGLLDSGRATYAPVLAGVGSFGSIQAAVDAASPGATINIPAGTYHEAVTVTKPLTIVGAGVGLSILDNASITGDWASWFSVNANDVTIRGFTMVNSNTAYASGGLYVNAGVQRFILESCDISYAVVNIAFGGTTDSIIRNCVIHDALHLGIRMAAPGPTTGRGQRNEISNNQIYHNNMVGYPDPGADGGNVKATGQDNLRIINNLVYDSTVGLWLDVWCINATVSGNKVHHNDTAGIMDETSTGTKIFNNVTWENGFGPYGAVWGWGAGILVSSSKNAEVYNNICAWNYAGISVIDQNRTDNPGVTGNYVHDNQVMEEQPTAGNDRYGLFWANDYSGSVMYSSGSNNRGLNNSFWYPAAENAFARFIWNGFHNLSSFSATPGGAGSTYMSDATKTAALAAAGAPAAP